MIGIPTANRGRREVEGLIGFFVNTLALRIDVSGEPSVVELLSRVRKTALLAQEHQDLPFEQVVEIVSPPRRLDQSPVFQVMCTWEQGEGGGFALGGLKVEPAGAPLETVKFDVELSLGEVDGGIVGGLRYATALFDGGTIERHGGYLEGGASCAGRGRGASGRTGGVALAERAEAAARDVERDGKVVSAGAMHPRAVRGAGAPERRRRWRWCKGRRSCRTGS